MDVISSDGYEADGIMRTAALDWLSACNTLREAAIGTTFIITYTQTEACPSGYTSYML